MCAKTCPGLAGPGGTSALPAAGKSFKKPASLYISAIHDSYVFKMKTQSLYELSFASMIGIENIFDCFDISLLYLCSMCSGKHFFKNLNSGKNSIKILPIRTFDVFMYDFHSLMLRENVLLGSKFISFLGKSFGKSEKSSRFSIILEENKCKSSF